MTKLVFDRSTEGMLNISMFLGPMATLCKALVEHEWHTEKDCLFVMDEIGKQVKAIFEKFEVDITKLDKIE